MKNDLRKVFGLLSVVVILMVSCQGDENSSYVNPEALGKSSQLTTLLQRVAQARAVDDNVLDSASCFKIKLPINLAVNGQFLSVQDESDYLDVANIFNASNADEDYLEFNYPLVINHNGGGEQTLERCNRIADFAPDLPDSGGCCANRLLQIGVSVQYFAV
ncbi:hypothetical protein [Flavobacterium sp.]|uniref:hypothetical protein n=1 Tax=Flavobacterium sp. TaxID=239 RepID=UPI0039E418FA